MKKIVIAAAVVALSAGSAFAQVAPPTSGNTASTNGSATAKVVAPITLTHDNGAALAFGTFTAGTGGTVDVTSGGAGTVTGDVGFVSGSTNTADAFTVGGDAGRNFSITTASGSVSTGGSTPASMNFTTAPSANSGTIGTGGTATFTVGGSLTVGSGQAAGDYSGSYSATVTYN